MATTIYTMGGGEFELSDDEKYNKVRKRLNDLANAANELDDDDGKSGKDPFTKLQFFDEDGGRISLNPDKIIAIRSDLRTDKDDE